MSDVFLGLGSNLGNRIENLRRALIALEEHVAVSEKSSVYESLPHGVDDQPFYLNMVVRATTPLTPRGLLAAVKMVEQNIGREPNTHHLPRPIDIDILMYGDEVVQDDDLSIPHRELHKRAFVLVPLEELASFHMHPTLRKPVIDLLDELGGYEGLVWPADDRL